jgi:hypothetical protein
MSEISRKLTPPINYHSKNGGSELDEIKNDIQLFKDDMISFKDDMISFKNDMISFKDDMKLLISDTINTLNGRMDVFDSKINNIIDELKSLKRSLYWGLVATTLSIIGVLVAICVMQQNSISDQLGTKSEYVDLQVRYF